MNVIWFSLGLIFLSAAALQTNAVKPEVQCTADQMRIELPIDEKTKSIYIQGLRDYPDVACRPHMDPTNNIAVLELDLKDVYRCAVTRVVNKHTGKKIYYQTLVVEKDDVRQTVHVKCSMQTLRERVERTRRQVFPAGFQEPEFLETTTSLIGMAPQPNITVGVRQAGKLVTGELNVSPGTPLQMEISLDSESMPIYGLLVTHMQVSDTKAQEETIIFNACSLDPYLFENFKTEDGDKLVAKFRAFKFPESSYVQFKGTVNVCLDTCKGVECSDGTIGYGRKKREVSSVPPDPNKIFEITITSFIKVNYEDDSENFEEVIKNQTKIFHDKKLIVGNQMADDVKYFKGVNERDVPVLSKNGGSNDGKYTPIFGENSATTTTITIYLRLLGLVAVLVNIL